MNCTSCGAGVDTNMRFCPYCGKAITDIVVSNKAQNQSVPQLNNADSSYSPDKESHQTIESKEKSFGILLCGTAIIYWILCIVTLILPSNIPHLLVTILCILPLSIVLLVIGLKEILLLRKVEKEGKANSYQLLLGIAFITLAIEPLYSVFHEYIYTDMLTYNEPGLTQDIFFYCLIYFLQNFILAASAVMILFAANEKKKGGTPSSSFIAAASLILAIIAFYFVYFYIVKPIIIIGSLNISLIESFVFNSLYTIVIVLLGVGLTPSVQSVTVVPVSHNNLKASGSQASLTAGDASSKGYSVLSFFIPIIGFFLYLNWKDQFPLKAKSCGHGALVGLITPVVLVLLLYFTFVLFYAKP